MIQLRTTATYQSRLCAFLEDYSDLFEDYGVSLKDYGGSLEENYAYLRIMVVHLRNTILTSGLWWLLEYYRDVLDYIIVAY